MTREELDAKRRELGRLSAEIAKLDRLLRYGRRNRDNLREADDKLAALQAEFRAALRALSEADLRRYALEEVKRLPGLDAATRRDLRERYRAMDAKRLRHELVTDTGLLVLATTASQADARWRAWAEGAQRSFEEAHADEIAAGRKVIEAAYHGPQFRRGVYRVSPATIRAALAGKMNANPGLSLTQARKLVAEKSVELFKKRISFETVKIHTKGDRRPQ